MSNQVYANGREVSCKAASGKSICAFPDVCLTPPPPPAGPIPIPYPNTGMASDTSDGSKTVQISGQEVMLKDSSDFKTSTGDEAATKSQGMNVITHQIQGKCYYTSWSMDVKIEGENAVRHLDLMTHNHASTPGGTPPWPYMDEMAMADPEHPCEKSGDKKKVADNCGDPPEKDHSAKCCDARKCMMVPEHKDKCCGGKTPHHAIPAAEFLKPRPPKSSGSFPRRGESMYPDYKPSQAPCICLEGDDHDKKDASGRLMEHGRCGAAFAKKRNDALGKRKEYEYQEASPIGAEAVAEVTGCDKACIQRQIDDGHAKMNIKPTDKLRKSPQKAKGYEPPAPATPSTG
jgi:hypothetical protein